MDAALSVLVLCLCLVAAGGVFWCLYTVQRRCRIIPAALWIWGWLSVFSATLLGAQTGWDPWTQRIAHVAGPMLPGLLVAGAIAYAGRLVPRWLLPAALAVGLVRAATDVAGLPAAGHGVALAVEPAGAMLAAWIVHRAERPRGASLVQHALVAALAGVALLETGSGVFGLRGAEHPTPLLVAWLALGPVTLGLQIAASLERRRERQGHWRREHARVRQALGESEERFRALTENAFDLIAETDAAGHVTYTNPRFEEVVGARRGRLPDARIRDFVHPEDRARIDDMVAEAGLRGLARPTVARCEQEDGSCRWIESRARAFRTADGQLRLVVSASDVTAHTELARDLRRARDELEGRVRKRTEELAAAVVHLEQEVEARERAERELRTSEERYRTISQLSWDFCFAYRLNADRQLLDSWVTDAFTRTTGFTREETVDRDWSLVLHPDDRERGRQLVREVWAGEAREFDARVVTKDGRVRCLRWRMAGEVDPGTGEIRVVGASQDVTESREAAAERQRLEEHLQEVQRLESLGMLAGGIAHDFSNLLSVILGNSSLALLDAEDGTALRDRLGRIRSAAQQAAGLTEQMLTYSGRAAVTMKALHLPYLVEGMRELLEASVHRNTRLRIEADTGLPLIEGDEVQLRQVVMNLVTNASEALDGEAAEVAIRLRCAFCDADGLAEGYGSPDLPPGDYLVLEVSDTGRGIDEATRPHVFEPFFTTRSTGRGIGLAAVLGIVRAHRGSITIESEPSRGTTFRVRLPVPRGD